MPELAPDKKPLSVFQLTSYIKALLCSEPMLSSVLVEGEISNLKYHSSGHVYFSLKDERAIIKCVMFRSQAALLRVRLQDGDKVVVRGRIDVYESGGTYQIYVTSVKKAGLGDLYERYSLLLEKLKAKGYFDESHKKPLPAYAKTIALITSKTSAAVRDMISILRRRFPGVNILVCSVRVQGEGAAREIASMIDYVSANEPVDLIIVGRGGGSFEDLFAFSEEIVADAVYRCSVPIISAVGHETDFSISDFVADLRAPTPSAAAELAVGEMAAITELIEGASQRLLSALVNRLLGARERLESLEKRRSLALPESLLAPWEQRIDELGSRCERSAKQNIVLLKERMSYLSRTLDNLSYENTLKRGYAIVWQKGRVISSLKEYTPNTQTVLQFIDGKTELPSGLGHSSQGDQNEI